VIISPLKFTRKNCTPWYNRRYEIYHAISGKTPSAFLNGFFYTHQKQKEGLRPAYSISGKTNLTDWGTVPMSSDDTGWYNSNSGSKTHEVGKKSANAFYGDNNLGFRLVRPNQ